MPIVEYQCDGVCLLSLDYWAGFCCLFVGHTETREQPAGRQNPNGNGSKPKVFRGGPWDTFYTYPMYKLLLFIYIYYYSILHTSLYCLLGLISKGGVASKLLVLGYISQRIITRMSVWVQSRSGHEEAFKVDFSGGMDFADLKERITLKRHVLNFPVGAVQSIHSENSDDERFKLRAGAKVPVPIDGEVGASDDLPYYFSIVQTQAGNIFLI